MAFNPKDAVDAAKDIATNSKGRDPIRSTNPMRKC